MQNLTPQVISALDNLPGFPSAPSSSPPAADQFILGTYLAEIAVRPAVAALVNLPLIANTLGDVRFVVALGTWYWWNGAAWLPTAGGGGGVVAVTASAPLASSGGAAPDISFPSWPANAVGALTNDGAGNLSWGATSSGSAVYAFSVATVALGAGEIVRFVTGGAEKADANAPLQLKPVGVVVAAAGVGAPVTICTSGTVDMPATQFDVAPIAANVGETVWLSTTAGKVTLTAPTAIGSVVQKIGILETLAGGGGGSPQILVQIGDPVLL